MRHIALCDDDERDRRALMKLLPQLPGFRRSNDLRFSEYAGGEKLLSGIREKKDVFDLIFLDIFMPGLSGMETAREIRALGIDTPIVFLTTSPDFALESYDVNAVDYLLKPVDAEKLQRVLSRLPQQETGPHLSIRSGKRVVNIMSEHILYIESDRNKLTIHTATDTFYQYGKLDDLEKQLPQDCFLRCHKSFLVNMNHIYAAEDQFRMDNGEIVPIKVRERRAIREAYFRYITEG